MTDPLSGRARNRALLARQGLLEPLTSPVGEALQTLGGLQAQYTPSMYVGLWSRRADTAREELTRALEDRSAVLGTLMRATIHVVARADFWPFALATRDARRTLWLRTRRDLTADAMQDAARRLRERLDGEGSITRAALETLVGKARAGGVGHWLELVRIPPSGTWERRRADLFAAAEDWIGPPEGSATEGLAHLVRRYLAAFGPAAPADIARYTGVPRAQLTPVLDALALRPLRSPSGERLLDVPGAPLPPADTPAPVRFLPTWDATLLVHARGTAVLAEEHRPRIFTTRNPHSAATFLVDGAVAGTWRVEDGRVALDPFAPLDAAATRALEEEAARLAAFHA